MDNEKWTNINIEKWTITRIRRGKDENKDHIFAELRDENGRLIQSSYLSLILKRIKEMTKGD